MLLWATSKWNVKVYQNNFIVNNDNMEVDARVFISDNQNGEESKTAERQREREFGWDGASLKVKDSVGHKTGRLEETYVIN